MNNLTVSCWFNAATFSTSFSRRLFNIQDSGPRNYELSYDYLTNKLIFVNYNVSNTATLFYSRSIFSPNNWYHVALKIDSLNNTSLYVNGVLDTVSTNTIIKPINPTYTFGSSLTQNWNFVGKIDDIRVYNRAVSQNEIAQLYALNTACLCAEAGTDKNICSGKNVQLNATGGTTYSWTPTAGLSNANIANPIASPLVTTKYYVTVGNGTCTATDSVTVVVDTINLSAGEDNSLCIGDSLQLQASGALSYTWTPIVGLSNPSIANPKTSPFKTTDYVVKGIAGACSAYDTMRVSVCVCSNTTIYDTVVVYRYDTIRISVTDTLFIDITTGLSPSNSVLNTIKIFPNPSHDELHIHNGKYLTMPGYSVKIINALGQSVFNNIINQEQFTISTSSLGGSGTYIVQIIDANNQIVETKKLIIQ